MKRKIAIAETEHGALSARHSGKDGQWALPGTFIEIDWQPNAGWGLSEAHYVAGGTETPINLGVKGFVMPDADVVIGGTFKRFIVQDWTTNDKESSGKVLGIDENGNLTPVEGGGGGGGTNNYNDLENKPSINGATLQGNVKLPTFNDFAYEFGPSDENKAATVGAIFDHFVTRVLNKQEAEAHFAFDNPDSNAITSASVSVSFAGEGYLRLDVSIDASSEPHDVSSWNNIPVSFDRIEFDIDAVLEYVLQGRNEHIVRDSNRNVVTNGFNITCTDAMEFLSMNYNIEVNAPDLSIEYGILGLESGVGYGVLIHTSCLVPFKYV